MQTHPYCYLVVYKNIHNLYKILINIVYIQYVTITLDTFLCQPFKMQHPQQIKMMPKRQHSLSCSIHMMMPFARIVICSSQPISKWHIRIFICYQIQVIGSAHKRQKIKTEGNPQILKKRYLLKC